jgi:RNA polymerase sigma-70 factor (ECF subfamily)
MGTESESEKKASDTRSKELMRRFVAGDKAAFGEIFALHDAPLRRLAARIVVDDIENRVDDSVHEVWTSIIEGSAVYVETNAAFRAWLFRLLRNHCADDLRRRKTKAGGARKLRGDFDRMDPQAEVPDEVAQLSERSAPLARAIAALPPEERALVLAHQADKTLDEIARERRVPKSTVHDALSRAFSRLAAYLKTEQQPDGDDDVDVR